MRRGGRTVLPPFMKLLRGEHGGWEVECLACGHRYDTGGSNNSELAVVTWLQQHVTYCNQLRWFEEV